MSQTNRPANRWGQVFSAGHDRPKSWCKGCGYHRVVHGVHRVDCTVDDGHTRAVQLSLAILGGHIIAEDHQDAKLPTMTVRAEREEAMTIQNLTARSAILVAPELMSRNVPRVRPSKRRLEGREALDREIGRMRRQAREGQRRRLAAQQRVAELDTYPDPELTDL